MLKYCQIENHFSFCRHALLACFDYLPILSLCVGNVFGIILCLYLVSFLLSGWANNSTCLCKVFVVQCHPSVPLLRFMGLKYRNWKKLCIFLNIHINCIHVHTHTKKHSVEE